MKFLTFYSINTKSPHSPNINDVPYRISHRIDQELCPEWEYQPQHARFRHRKQKVFQ